MNSKVKILTSIICLSLIVVPLKVNAKTMAEYQSDVEKTVAELQEKKDKIAKNDAEVAEIKKNIASIESQIKTVENEISALQDEIEKSNKQIIKKSNESKKIMAYYQIENGDNAYLEYAFGATTITDMIYRMSIVEQLTAYNDQVMKELKHLIEENKRKKDELSSKKKELSSLKNQLQSEKERINADTARLQEAMPSLEQQLKSAQDSLKQLKSMNCRSNEDIIACRNRVYPPSSSGGVSIPSANGRFRPTTLGTFNQAYSGCGTYSNGTCSGHTGVDIGGYKKEIPIYPIADGVISSIYEDPAGALVVRIKHNIGGNTTIYSTYAHLSRYAKGIYVGKFVSYTETIGDMGNTGFSSGIHLHLEISTCDWNTMLKNDFKCSWKYYATSSTINPTNYITLPSSWSNR